MQNPQLDFLKKLESKHPPELCAKIGALFEGKEDALEFVLLYGQLAEISDDIVDEGCTMERLQQFTALEPVVFSHPYYQAHLRELLMAQSLINLTYFHTVKWEKSQENWKRVDARCLNHCGYNMLFAVLIIEYGIEAIRDVTLEFRESAHKNQLQDIELLPEGAAIDGSKIQSSSQHFNQSLPDRSSMLDHTLQNR